MRSGTCEARMVMMSRDMGTSDRTRRVMLWSSWRERAWVVRIKEKSRQERGMNCRYSLIRNGSSSLRPPCLLYVLLCSTNMYANHNSSIQDLNRRYATTACNVVFYLVRYHFIQPLRHVPVKRFHCHLYCYWSGLPGPNILHEPVSVSTPDGLGKV